MIRDISGNRYGKLTVIKFSHKDSRGNIYWDCKCDCGKSVTVRYGNLASSHTRSCGCLAAESTANRATKHGHTTHATKDSTYQTWIDMKSRCFNPNEAEYYNYGGRGITVCNKWKDSFKSFIADMGERPAGKTIDRINTNGNYEPDNCKWSTPKEQGNNQRRNHCLTFNGKTQTIQQWAEEINISENTLLYRIRRGWSIQRALQTIY